MVLSDSLSSGIVFVCFQCAFLVPVLSEMRRVGVQGSSFSEVQEPQALIVGPTRELVVQIFNEARKFSYNTMIRPVVLYGGVSVRYQLGKVDEGAHVVVGTPGRLLDVIKRRKVSTNLFVTNEGVFPFCLFLLLCFDTADMYAYEYCIK